MEPYQILSSLYNRSIPQRTYVEFLKDCRGCYRLLSNDGMVTAKDDLLLSKFYSIGKKCGVLFNIHFDQFEYNFWHSSYDPYRRGGWCDIIYRRRQFSHRRKRPYIPTQKYVRNVEHKKKDRKSENSKQAWCIEKQFTRDKAKNGRRRGLGRYVKELTSRCRRQRWRHLLANDRYEDIPKIERNYMTIDPWAYD